MLIFLVALLASANLGVYSYKPATTESPPFIISIGESYYSPQPTPNSYLSTTSSSFVSSTPAPESYESSSPVGFISSTYYDNNYLDHSQSQPSSAVKLEFNSDSDVEIPAKYVLVSEGSRYSSDASQAIPYASHGDYDTYGSPQAHASPAVKSSSDGKSYLDPQAQSTTSQLGLGQDVSGNSQIQYVTPNNNLDFGTSSNSQLQSSNNNNYNNNNGYNSGIGSASQTTYLNSKNNYGLNGFSNSQNQYTYNNDAKKTTWVNPQTLPLNGNNLNKLNGLNNFNNKNLNGLNSGLSLSNQNNFPLNNLNNKNFNNLNSLNNLNFNNPNLGNGNAWVNPQASGNINPQSGNAWVNPQLQSSGLSNPFNNNFNGGLIGNSAINIGASAGRINFQSQNVNVAFNSRLGSFNYVEPQPDISADARSGLGASNYVGLLPQQLIVNSEGEYSLDGHSFGSLTPPPLTNAFAPPIKKPQPTKSNKLEIAYQWRYLDWVHPAIQLTGRNFTVGNPFSQDVDVDRKGRVFVTSPQWLEGTPVTLSLVTNLRDQGGPLLTPYPDWTWHRNECNGLISVFRISVNILNTLISSNICLSIFYFCCCKIGSLFSGENSWIKFSSFRAGSSLVINLHRIIRSLYGNNLFTKSTNSHSLTLVIVRGLFVVEFVCR